MQPLKLHAKTTLLAGTITVAVMIATLLMISARVVNLVRDDQKELAQLQAANLADHINIHQIHQLQSGDQELARTTEFARRNRPNITGVRIWRREGKGFVEAVAATLSTPREPIPDDLQALLLAGKGANRESRNYAGPRDTLYHAFAPIGGVGKVQGAVEIIERLDNLPAVVLSYARDALWLALLAILLITIATYLLFRRFVYLPLEHLLAAIGRAKAGELDAQAPARQPDEIGQLSDEFNSLLSQVNVMTKERERQQEVLQFRVQEATAQLQQRNQQLEAANLELWSASRRLMQLERLAAAGQTAAKFAHEVGTPLNLIGCHVQLLRDELYDNPQAADERTEIIGEQIDRIERIVRQMLDRTRVDAAELEPVNLNALLKHIAEATAPMLEARRVRLETELDDALPQIAGDADHLQQVFINLINNALDAMPDGGSLRITTRYEVSPSANGHVRMVVVSVADTGGGMSAETRKRIFDPLYTTKERGKGAGLGLVVVSQVMREHDGEIEVESESGRGTRFTLRFPALSSGAVKHREEKPAVITSGSVG